MFERFFGRDKPAREQAEGGKMPEGLQPLPANDLRRRVDPGQLGFRTTADLDPASGLVGQERALRAIEFGAGIRQLDFNLFVLGPEQSGKTTAVKSYLEAKARAEPTPPDWVYVNNFRDPNKPIAISLPTGRAANFASAMVRAIDDLRTAVPTLFESEEYQTRRRAIDEDFRKRQEQAFAALDERAREQDIAVLRTPNGIAMAPLQDGQIVKPEIFSTFPEDVRKQFEERIAGLQRELEDTLEDFPRWQKERHERTMRLNEEMAELAVHQAVREARRTFADCPPVLEYLRTAKRDLVHNVGIFLTSGAGGAEENGGAPTMVHAPVDTQRDPRFRRYMVNVVVSHAAPNGVKAVGAPLIEELNPTLGNLLGRIEHIAQMGALVTDFLLIKSGALHRANGGYLLIDARKLLSTPLAWEALKRALKGHEIRIESPADGMGLFTAQSLDPGPIPLRLKVVLFGDRQLYYLLSQHEPDFLRLFKVEADFDDSIENNGDNHLAFARLVASVVRRHDLRAADADAVARLIEEAARLANDNQRLSLEIGALADILREADFWAAKAQSDFIKREHVVRAIEEKIQRADRVRDRSHEGITREIVLIDTSGAKTGQINGLSVLQIGRFAFGKPTRITARVRMGEGRVTDIEREVELGGPLHSKGVMILWGFLAGRYAGDMPLSLSASLVFEQSYGGVDGDSASSTELYALLSALSEVPIRQSLAVTGSINQYGEIQAIGGVNEKIEGYYDICKARGLTGDQGVLIPKANVQHLMLREDVVSAVEAGKFRIWPVATVDQGIEILTGAVAGERDATGKFPDGTINALVEAKLRLFAEARRAFSKGRPDGALTS